MDRDRFIEQFIAVFCATYMAQRYQEFCFTGWTDEKCKPPVEDAKHLAECAWEEMVEQGIADDS